MTESITTDAGAPLPAGTVTFLFTDVQGSTELFQQFPTAYRDAVRRHHELLHEAVAAHGGVVFETVGDAVYGAFSSPAAAVDAAVAGQRALAAEPWGETGPIRVRMGIHTGEVETQGRHYFGLPLYRCARIMAAAHGGQIVLSEEAARAAEGALDAAVELLELGAHRLKDLHEPERIVQVLAPGLERDFPPLRSLDSRPHNLPAQATALIGREREVGEVRDLLLREDVRLLTLTGPGGTGKTRLSLQVAAEVLEAFLDGAFFVPLAAVQDHGLVLPTIARTLGAQQLPEQPIATALANFLRDKDLLLILDNFEQVVDAAPEVAELMRACPRLKVLVSSRGLLRVYGEYDYPVPPLDLPPSERAQTPEALLQCEAVRLFVERARAARPSFTLDTDNADAVAEICRRVDGLPLAIELAAARLRLFTPRALLGRLEKRLQLLTGGARDLPARQQTLRDAIAWSYELLDPAERVTFRRLGVFAGGCTVEAAEAVCGAVDGAADVMDVLASLADKSLLRHDPGPDGTPRFIMLETIREFAVEQLETAGEAEEVGGQHATFFLEVAESAEPVLASANREPAMQRLTAEQDNMRAAVRWAVEHGSPELAMRLVGYLWLWYFREALAEGRRVSAEVAALPLDGRDPAARAWALLTVAITAWGHGQLNEVRRAASESVRIARPLGETRVLSWSLAMLGAVMGDDVEAGRAGLEELRRICRARGDEWGVGLAGVVGGLLFGQAGDHETAHEWMEEGAAIWRRLGDRWLMGVPLLFLGFIAVGRAELPEARVLLAEGLELFRTARDWKNAASALMTMGGIDRLLGNYPDAAAHLREGLRLSRELGDSGNVAACLVGVAGVLSPSGHATKAAALIGAAASIRESTGAAALPMSDALNAGVEEGVRQTAADDFEQSYTEGRSWTEETAVQRAMDLAALVASGASEPRAAPAEAS